jgi:hypothetical protein
MNSKTLITAALCFLLAQAAWAQKDFSSCGDSEASACEIASAQDLLGFSDFVNDEGNDTEGKHYKLAGDIDLSGRAWAPIGSSDDTPFKGAFDGGGKKISNLSYDLNGSRYAGVFGVVSGTVKNLGVINVSIYGQGEYGVDADGEADTYAYAGGVAGYLVAGATITDTYTTGTISVIGSYAGGIAGNVYGEIRNSYSTASVIGSWGVGGIAGRNEGEIENCLALNSSIGSGGGGIGGGQQQQGAAGFGRVSGTFMYGWSGGYENNNYAYQNIGGNYCGDGRYCRDVDYLYPSDNAATTSLSQIKTLMENFVDVYWSESGLWVAENGKLPGFGAAEDLPAHMVPWIFDMYFSGSGIITRVKGSSEEVTVYVQGTIDLTASFELAGSSNPSTYVGYANCYTYSSSQGYCTASINIAANETASALTLTATSNGDPDYAATLTINVVEPVVYGVHFEDDYGEEITEIAVVRGLGKWFYACVAGIVGYAGFGVESSSPDIEYRYNNSDGNCAVYYLIASENASGQYTLTMTSRQDPSKSATLKVNAVEGYISRVTVNYGFSQVQQGNSVQFGVSVEGEAAPTTVSWTVSGSTSRSTRIDASGILYAASDEMAETLTIRATSAYDRSKYGEAAVTVLRAPAISSAQRFVTAEDGELITPIRAGYEETTYAYSVDGTSAIDLVAKIDDIAGDCSGVSFDGYSKTITVPAGMGEGGKCKVALTASNAYGSDMLEFTLHVVGEPTVTSVAVSPEAPTVRKTEKRQFSATVAGENYPSEAVAWTVEGIGEGSLTAISSRGVLAVAANESAATLTVRATSIEDGSKSETATVTLADAPAAIAAPTLRSNTRSSITLNELPAHEATGQTAEYAISEANSAPASGWQQSTYFGGLENGKTYYLFARASENSAWLAGAASAALEATAGDFTSPIIAGAPRGAGSLGAYAAGGTLHISGLAKGKAYSIYTVSGALVHQGVAGGASASVPLRLGKGVYIVKSNGLAARFASM